MRGIFVLIVLVCVFVCFMRMDACAYEVEGTHYLTALTRGLWHNRILQLTYHVSGTIPYSCRLVATSGQEFPWWMPHSCNLYPDAQGRVDRYFTIEAYVWDTFDDVTPYEISFSCGWELQDYNGKALKRWRVTGPGLTVNAVVKAKHMSPSEDLENLWNVEYESVDLSVGGDCNECEACDSAGSAKPNLNSMHMQISLGKSDYGSESGYFEINAQEFSSSVYKRNNLCVRAPASFTKISDASGIVRQVLSSDCLANVVEIDDKQYKIEFFDLENKGILGADGVYIQENGAVPFKTIAVSGDPDLNKIVFSEQSEMQELVTAFYYDAALKTWYLQKGNGPIESRSEQDSGDARTVTYSILEPNSSAVTYKEVLAYKKVSGTFLLIKKVVAPDESFPQVWEWEYDTSVTRFGKTISMKQSSGYWEMYYYDAGGGLSKTKMQINNAPFDAPENQCRVKTNSYDSTSVPAKRVESEFISGVETHRKVTLYTTNYEDACEYVNMPIGSGSAARTNYIKYLDAEKNIDYSIDQKGLVRCSRSGTQSGICTETTDYGVSASGFPANPGNDAQVRTIVDGQRTVTSKDPAGNVILTVITDIKTDQIISSQSASQLDSLGRPSKVDFEDGTSELIDQDCCSVTKTDRSGITNKTVKKYGQVVREERGGLATIYTYDGKGNCTASTREGNDGSQMLVESSSYDTAGRLLSKTDALNHTTLYSEQIDGRGNAIKTTTYPDASTVIQSFSPDGKLTREAGTAVHPKRYEYGVNASLGEFTKEIRIAEDGSEREWVKTFFNPAGQVTRVESAGTTGVATREYNNYGQLVKQSDADSVTTLYTYTNLGEQDLVAVDINRNGQIDLDGTDRVTRSKVSYATRSDLSGGSSIPVQHTDTYVWTATSGTNGTLFSTVDTTSSGQQSVTTQNGKTTKRSTTLGSDGAYSTLEINPDDSRRIRAYQNGLLLADQVVGKDGVSVASGKYYQYDAFGRVQRMSNAEGVFSDGNCYIFIYYNDGSLQSATTPAPATGEPVQTTCYEYDWAGHKLTETTPDNTVMHREYWPTGELKHAYGGRQYETSYGYDAQGRMTSLVTASGTTSWIYDPQRGLLNSKAYSDGTGPSYTYTSAGRLETRQWARTKDGPSVVTTYGYDNAGDVGTITYSDGTPGVTYHRNSLGQVYQIDDAAGSRTIGYNADGQQETETYTSGLFSGITLKSDYETGLRTGFNVLQGTTPLVAQSIGYDNYGRLATFAQGSVSGTYGYKPGRDLVETVAHLNNGQNVFTTQKSYDGVDRLTGIAEIGGVNIPSTGYTYNAANQRERVDRGDGTFWQYGYDTLGQLASGSRHWNATDLVSGQQYGYQFDGIGNRTKITVNGWPSYYTPGMPAGLNQYTSRTVPGVVELMGQANADTVVSVTGSNASGSGTSTIIRAVRYGEYWHAPLRVDNTAAPVLEELDILALKPNVAEGQDGVMHQTGRVAVPKTPEMFHYDEDGNLTQDGLWKYSWDGENRLIGIESVTGLPAAGKKKLEFAYDASSRRISKKVYRWSEQSGEYESAPATESRFLYDGWNLVAEVDGANNVTRSYLWGLDLSNTQQEAGGVGGLLAIMTTGTNAGTYFTAYDGNGNVTDLVNAVDGNSVAQYEYGPFGEPLRVSGAMAAQNPFRFSTKYTDDETGLIYYGYRYYNPSTGGWISRDPIQENGGLNLYGFVNNQVVTLVDIFGLRSLSADDVKCCTDKMIADGEVELNKRYREAVAAAKSLCLKPASPGSPGASCITSSADIIEYLIPTPKCWTCNLEARTSLGGIRDHQVIICKAYLPGPKQQKEIMFDWWGDTDGNGNTKKQTRDPKDFRWWYPNLSNESSTYPRTNCDGTQYPNPGARANFTNSSNLGFPNSTSPLPGSSNLGK